MKGLIRVMLAIAVTMPTMASAGEVISNESLSLTPDEIREVFLGEKQLTHGLRLVPVDNGAVQDEFLAKVLQTDSQKYYARWTRKSFREGIAYVKATRGAIGYTKGHSVGVNILQSF
jgi:hypothetical protein